MENPKTKTCATCLVEKSTIDFQKNRGSCRICRSAQAKMWRVINKDRHDKYQAQYKAKRYNTDIQFKLKHVLRARLRKALKNEWKSGSSVEELGCSILEFKAHLESQFQPGMTWDNWGVHGWHIDHVVPLDSFDLADKEEFKKACHYTNLQPMWGVDNSIKSNKVI